MSQNPIITNVIVLPGVSISDTLWTLQIGLVMDERRIVWGECRFDAAEFDNDLPLNEGIQILQEIIIPALLGQPPANVVPLMEGIDGMARDVTLVKAVTADMSPQRRSRRELFSSLLNPTDEIREVVKRPLPPALRNGVSQVLIAAAAMAQGWSVAETIAGLYGLQLAESPPDIHLVFDDLPNPADPVLSRVTAPSYGLVVGGEDPVKELGKDGVRFQNRVRQLKNRVVHTANGANSLDGQETSFLFDVNGGYGLLYEEKTGPVLGALFGLEQVTKPYGLRLVDPFLMDDRQSQLDVMGELRNFIRMRKMRTRLLARSGIETADDIQALADRACCDGVVLDMTRLGTLHQSIVLAQAARERELEVVVTGVYGRAAVHAALALKPTLLAVGTAELPTVANEINRTLAWQNYKK